MIADPLVSIIIVTHNNQDDIVDCVNSVLSQGYQCFEIIIVDNASTDETVIKIEHNFGDSKVVKLIKSAQNRWYTGGNNLGFEHSKGELIAMLNPDIIVGKFWLSALVDAYHRQPNVGIVGSNVLLFDNIEKINACGNDIHLTGFVFSRFYGENVACNCKREEVIAAPSGASFLFSTYKLRAIGRKLPFDYSRFVMDYSDADLAIDFLSHGFLCYIAPSSEVLHKFKFKMNPGRLFILETGRYQLLGHLRMKTLLMMLPAIILTELIVWAFIMTKDRRLIRSKISVLLWLFSHSRKILRSDNSAAKDLKLIKQMTPDIKLYLELSDGLHPSYLQKSLMASNQLYRLTRRILINLLSTEGKREVSYFT